MNIFYFILTIVIILLFGYLIGSIPTSIIISKKHGIDVRGYGSHNAGGTNVGRVVSKKAGITTMVIDIFKCFIPLLILKIVFQYTGLHNLDLVQTFKYSEELFVGLLAFAIALGHTYPIYVNFKGGKAVACFAGFILFISPIIFAIGVATFFIVFAISNRVSVASIIGAPMCFILSIIPMILDLTILPDINQFNGGMYYGSQFMLHLSYISMIFVFLLTFLILLRHLSNIKRLKEGIEPETHFKK